MKTVVLEPYPRQLGDTNDWTQGPPFAVNPNGYLIHRVRRAHTHLRDGKPHHESCDYWCGNVTCDPLFTDDPPTDRLLCERCEAIAVKHGRPAADQLAGRHVHIGRLRPIRVCCSAEGN